MDTQNVGSARALAFHAASLNNATSALAFLEQAPKAAGDDTCMPVCTWHCSTPQCAQVCEPDCEAPRCDTRCTKKDTSTCNFNCAQPSCAIVCPKQKCAKSECPKCSAVCGQPKCTLECQGYQPCYSVCEQPACRWRCRKPDVCPEPKCSMVCESPKTCPEAGVHQDLPPVANDTVVQSWNVPHALHSGVQYSTAHQGADEVAQRHEPPDIVPEVEAMMPSEATIPSNGRLIERSNVIIVGDAPHKFFNVATMPPEAAAANAAVANAAASLNAIDAIAYQNGVAVPR